MLACPALGFEGNFYGFSPPALSSENESQGFQASGCKGVGLSMTFLLQRECAPADLLCQHQFALLGHNERKRLQCIHQIWVFSFLKKSRSSLCVMPGGMQITPDAHHSPKRLESLGSNEAFGIIFLHDGQRSTVELFGPCPIAGGIGHIAPAGDVDGMSSGAGADALGDCDCLAGVSICCRQIP